MAKIGIIGAGSWGIALAMLLYNNKHSVSVWSALGDEIDMLNSEREHKDKLPGVKLPMDMIFTKDLSDVTTDKEFMPHTPAFPRPVIRSLSLERP